MKDTACVKRNFGCSEKQRNGLVVGRDISGAKSVFTLEPGTIISITIFTVIEFSALSYTWLVHSSNVIFSDLTAPSYFSFLYFILGSSFLFPPPPSLPFFCLLPSRALDSSPFFFSGNKSMSTYYIHCCLRICSFHFRKCQWYKGRCLQQGKNILKCEHARNTHTLTIQHTHPLTHSLYSPPSSFCNAFSFNR